MKPLPNSRKVYVEGSRPDIRVPMREITQSDTPLHSGAAAQGGAAAHSEPNPPIFVYDTSGPYTDPTVKIDIRSGLAPLRQQWIEERNDTEELAGPSSHYGRERARRPEARATALQPEARSRAARVPGMNVTQMHYARRGIITPEMEFIAIRENQRLDALSELMHAAAPGASPSAPRSRRRSRRSSCATRSRAAAPSFPPTSITRKPSR